MVTSGNSLLLWSLFLLFLPYLMSQGFRVYAEDVTKVGRYSKSINFVKSNKVFIISLE